MSYDENEMTNETYETTEPMENMEVRAQDYANFHNTEPKPQPPAKSNLAAGIVGAFLGALIGCVLWILIWKLGYIAGIAGFAIGVCALKGYELLGKSLDIKGAIVSVVIMIIMIFLANKIAWSIDAYDALKDYGWSFFDIFQNLDYIVEESELTSAYTKDLIIGYLLTALSSFKLIVGAFSSAIQK